MSQRQDDPQGGYNPKIRNWLLLAALFAALAVLGECVINNTAPNKQQAEKESKLSR